jgi:hypothetical protein
LGVECDGDEWHTPETFEKDMYRQRILERCGWTFFRIRGSEYYRNPDKTLEKLWSVLDRFGIYPSYREERKQDPFPNTEIRFVQTDFPADKSEIGSPLPSRVKQEVDSLTNNNVGKTNLERKATEVPPGSEVQKVSLDDIIFLITRILKKHGRGAREEDIEKEIYVKFSDIFALPWYQETVSTGVRRWQYLVNMSLFLAKHKKLIKRSANRRDSYWELVK